VSTAIDKAIESKTKRKKIVTRPATRARWIKKRKWCVPDKRTENPSRISENGVGRGMAPIKKNVQ